MVVGNEGVLEGIRVGVVVAGYVMGVEGVLMGEGGVVFNMMGTVNKGVGSEGWLVELLVKDGLPNSSLDLANGLEHSSPMGHSHVLFLWM